MSIIEREARRPTVPEKRHSPTRPATLIAESVSTFCVTDDHDEAKWVEERTQFVLGYRKAAPAVLDRPQLTINALERQAQTIAAVVLRRL